MNKNAIKIVIVVLCLGVAGFLIAKQFGIIGGSSATPTAANTGPEGAAAATGAESPKEAEASQAGTLKRDRF